MSRSDRHRVTVPRCALLFPNVPRWAPLGSGHVRIPRCDLARCPSLLMLPTSQLLPRRDSRRWPPTRPVSRTSRQRAAGPPGSYSDRAFTSWQ
jgi:hypothetical protein